MEGGKLVDGRRPLVMASLTEVRAVLRTLLIILLMFTDSALGVSRSQKQHEASESIRKCHKASGGVRRLQEASGKLRKNNSKKNN